MKGRYDKDAMKGRNDKDAMKVWVPRDAAAKALGAEDVVAAVREEYGFEPEGYTLYGYGAVQVWAHAVSKANSLDLQDVIKVLKTETFDSVMGTIGFDEKGDVTGISSFVWNVFEKDGYVPVH